MKTQFSKPVIAALIALSAGLQVQAGTTTPTRVSTTQLTQYPYYCSGVVMNSSWRGSGTVAVNPKVVVSCAHVTYNNGAWLNGNKFNRAWHGAGNPFSLSSSQDLRGYWKWTSYSGGTSNAAFNADFVAYYAYTNLANGASTGYQWSDSTSAHPLNSTSTGKLMVGYPGTDGYWMNSVGAFTTKFSSQHGHYFWNPSIKAIGGMSGGGVFVNVNGDYRLAGVTVSAAVNNGWGAGVRALNGEAYQLITSAISSANAGTPVVDTVRTFSSTARLAIPDNKTTWTVRSLAVSSMPVKTTSVKVSLNISHTYRGDLEVTITSPAGRTLTLHNRTGGSADHVVITSQDVGSSFNGSNPNGTWKISMRDLVRGDTGALNSASLTIASR